MDSGHKARSTKEFVVAEWGNHTGRNMGHCPGCQQPVLKSRMERGVSVLVLIRTLGLPFRLQLLEVLAILEREEVHLGCSAPHTCPDAYRVRVALSDRE